MRIVNIEDYFIPDAGYQINILPKYFAKFGHEVYIVTATTDWISKPSAEFFGTKNMQERDADYTAQTGVKIIRVRPLMKKLISSRVIQSKELFRTVDLLNPDIVYVHGNDTLTGMRYLHKKVKKYAVITDSHMLSMASRNPLNKLFYWFYKMVITPKIIHNQVPVIRTQDDPFVEKNLGIPLQQAPWISYGSDTLLFYPDSEIKRSFRAKHGISDDDFVIVYTGKLDEAKGGELLAQAFRERFQTQKSVVLIVVGNTSGEYGKEIEKIFSESENRIIRFPTQKYCDLAQFYQAADLSVFAKQCSLSFYDAQACGLPVLSEDNNINIDRCSHGNGWNFKSGDVEDFKNKITDIVNMDVSKLQQASENAYKFIIDNYNYEDKAREYENIIEYEFNRRKRIK